MSKLYQVLHISKQAFHKRLNCRFALFEEQQQLLVILPKMRENHPRMSCRRFYDKLKPRTMGRDQFEAFCHSQGYKVSIRKRKYKTTDSKGVNRFPNLLLTMRELKGINQLWVSDITYFEIGQDVYYLTLIMDVYNREIVGYCASDNLRTESTTLKALNQAIKKRRLFKESGLIFHSDGGGQYYSKQFTIVTKAYSIMNSMGKTAYENPFAERINGIVKNDYLYPWNPKNMNELQLLLKKAVTLYNNDRPHGSLYNHTPQAFIELVNKGVIKKTWIVNKTEAKIQKEKTNISIK